VAPVDGLGVDTVLVPHQPRQLLRVRLRDEVMVVAHQAASQDIGVQARLCLGDHAELALGVGVVPVDRLATFAAEVTW
jgi:hypothetical protein